MISIHKAQNIILKNSYPLPHERILFLNAFQRILAGDLKSPVDWPPFSRSTMDGFAVKSQDVALAVREKKQLVVIDTIEAGSPSKKILKTGQAMKIMTGGVVPHGADSVIMKEFVSENSKRIKVVQGVLRGQNISFQGEDFKRGQTVLKQGQRINEGSMALLAAMGFQKVPVYQRPRVVILVTGNELLSLEEKLTPGKIRNTNQYALTSLVEKAGGNAVSLGACQDDLHSLKNKIRQGFSFDMLLISGGMSVGDFDFVPQALKGLGVDILFHGVSVQPGKPLLFGRKGKTLIFGLPGNPISSMVSFYKFVYPCLLKISGCQHYRFKTAKAILAEDVSVPSARTKIMRGIVFDRDENLFVKLASHQGSGNMLSMVRANCLFEIPEGRTYLKKGTRTIIQYLP